MEQTVILILIGSINIFLWLFLFARFKKMFSSEKLLKDVRREVEKLLIEIDRTADQDITILEARIKSLHELINEADDKILLAKNAGKTKLREKKVFEDINKVYNTQQDENNSVKVDIDFESYKIPMQMQGTNRGGPENIEGEGDRQDTSIAQSLAGSDVSDDSLSIEQKTPFVYKLLDTKKTPKERTVKEKVLELYKAGFDYDSISQNLEISVREIELIVSMFG